MPNQVRNTPATVDVECKEKSQVNPHQLRKPGYGLVRKFEPRMDFGALEPANITTHNPLSDPFVTRRPPNMNRLALGWSLLLLLSLSTNAQNNETPGDDVSAVRSTVTNYIEAYYTSNAARMEQTLHPHYLKQKIHGNIPVREQTRADLVQAARTGEGTHLTEAARTEQVTVLDVAGNIASAKLVTPGWTDYMTLTKVDGEWKILSVVQRIDD